MKKDELRHDPVRDNIIRVIENISQNKSKFLNILILIAILIGFYSYYNYSFNLKIENSLKLSSKAQTSMLNGNIDESIIKFERLLQDYPDSKASVHSLVYISNNYLKSNDIDDLDNILSNNKIYISDPIVRSLISKTIADLNMSKNNISNAISNYKEAIKYDNLINLDKFKISLANAYILNSYYEKAFDLLSDLLKNKDIGYEEKNMSEELLSFVKHKMSI